MDLAQAHARLAAAEAERERLEGAAASTEEVQQLHVRALIAERECERLGIALPEDGDVAAPEPPEPAGENDYRDDVGATLVRAAEQERAVHELALRAYRVDSMRAVVSRREAAIRAREAALAPRRPRQPVASIGHVAAFTGILALCVICPPVAAMLVPMMVFTVLFRERPTR